MEQKWQCYLEKLYILGYYFIAEFYVNFIEHRIGRAKLVLLNTANWYGTETLNWKIETRLEIDLRHWDSDSDAMHGDKPIQKYLKCLLCIDWLFFFKIYQTFADYLKQDIFF